MKTIYFFLMLIFCAFASVAQSIKDLDFLIGEWDVNEIVLAGTDKEYSEKGSRECSYYLDGSYIKSESKSRRHGRDRSYTFLFNYEKEEERFRLIKLSSDFSAYSVKSWKIDQELKLIKEEDLGGYQFVSSISFEDRNKVVWKGYSPRIGKESDLKLVFTEIATRK